MGCLDTCLDVPKRIKNFEHFLWVKKMPKVEELCHFGIREKLYLFLDVTAKRGNSDQK